MQTEPEVKLASLKLRKWATAGRSPMPLTMIARSTLSTSSVRNASSRGSVCTMAYLIALTLPRFTSRAMPSGVRYPSDFT